jgi:hypothetical protein
MNVVFVAVVFVTMFHSLLMLDESQSCCRAPEMIHQLAEEKDIFLA